ncbi:MAG: hypothetical protein QM498_06720 [Desulfobacterium sp.]
MCNNLLLLLEIFDMGRVGECIENDFKPTIERGKGLVDVEAAECSHLLMLRNTFFFYAIDDQGNNLGQETVEKLFSCIGIDNGEVRLPGSTGKAAGVENTNRNTFYNPMGCCIEPREIDDADHR